MSANSGRGWRAIKFLRFTLNVGRRSTSQVGTPRCVMRAVARQANRPVSETRQETTVIEAQAEVRQTGAAS